MKKAEMRLVDDMLIMFCTDCGIEFGIPEKVASMWMESGRRFQCPNGCWHAWSKKDVKGEMAKDLEAKVAGLEAKLATSEARVVELGREVDSLRKRSEELASELEIWRPSSVKESV